MFLNKETLWEERPEIAENNSSKLHFNPLAAVHLAYIHQRVPHPYSGVSVNSPADFCELLSLSRAAAAALTVAPVQSGAGFAAAVPLRAEPVIAGVLGYPASQSGARTMQTVYYRHSFT